MASVTSLGLVNYGQPARQPTIPQINVGYIVDQLAGSRWYLVRTEFSTTTGIPCKDISGQGLNVLGPKQIRAYPVGTAVLYVFLCSAVEDETGNLGTYTPMEGYIIGAVPTAYIGGKYTWSDWVTPFDGSDDVNDPISQDLYQVPDAYENWNEGRPADVNAGSDEGVIHEFGNGYGVSRYFSWLRASDIAGLWCFVLDDLTRVAAYNYDFWSSGGERWIRNDNGEVSDVDTFAPYSWEALGSYTVDSELFEEIEDGGLWKQGHKQLQYEPKEQDQIGFYRLLALRGHLADLVKNMVTLLPAEADIENEDSVATESEDLLYRGVSDAQQHTNGLYSVRSAQGILLEKYMALPVPKRTHPVEDDTDGHVAQWAGSDAELPEKNEWRWNMWPSQWPSSLWDYHSYMFNYYSLRTLVDHNKDWYVPNESELNSDFAAAHYNPSETEGIMGNARFAYKAPPHVDIQIDHREGTTRYYKSRSLIGMLPDGSIAIEDGYGSGMYFTGGNILQTCAGDLQMRPGRGLIAHVPDDIVLKAGMSVDVTATWHDVRIASYQNVLISAMSSEEDGEPGGPGGGVYIESRAKVISPGGTGTFVSPSWENGGESIRAPGVFINCADAPFQLYSKCAYMAAKDWSSDTDCYGGGVFVIDSEHTYSAANEGITFLAGRATRASQAHAGFMFAFEGDNNYLEDGASILRQKTSGLFAGEDIGVTIYQVTADDTQVEINGKVFAKEGEIGDGAADDADLKINSDVTYPDQVLTPDSIIEFQDAGGVWHDCRVSQPEDLKFDGLSGGANVSTPTDISFPYDYMYIFNSNILWDARQVVGFGFSFRTSPEMGTTQYRMVETRWQQLYRQTDTDEVWEESLGSTIEHPIVPPQLITAPHPGYDAADNLLWGSDIYLKYNHNLYDIANKYSKDRGEDGIVYKDIRNTADPNAELAETFVDSDPDHGVVAGAPETDYKISVEHPEYTGEEERVSTNPRIPSCWGT